MKPSAPLTADTHPLATASCSEARPAAAPPSLEHWAAPDLPPPECLTDPDIIAGYLQDASRLVGHAERLYRPSSEAEVAALLRQLSAEQVPVTVVARQTSTTGSSVPQGGAILSMEKLQRLLWLDPSRARACAQGGILLGDFQRALEAEGWLYPPDPTSRNESTLGASVACNASGARTFKYGPTRPYVERLRIVLADGLGLEVRRGQHHADLSGTILLLTPDGEPRRLPCPRYAMPAVKHAAGYHAGEHLDLIDLFIGSEGTLGVITEVEVRLLPLPAKVVSILACWPDEKTAFTFVRRARSERQAGGLDPRCLEWFDAHALELLRQRYPSLGLPQEAGAAVFFEQECTDTGEADVLEQWYTLLSETGALVEAEQGVMVADNDARQQLLYELRHAVPAGVNEKAAHNRMPKLGTDLAVPDEALEQMMQAYADSIADVPSALGLERMLRLMGQLEQLSLPPLDSEVGRRAALDLLSARCSPPLTPAELEEEPVQVARRLWTQLNLPFTFESATFGHIGNNHVHVNLLPTSPAGLTVARALYDVLTERAIRLGGTVSGEHGIGKNKRGALQALLGADAVEQMRRLKRVLDPQGLLGRGNLFELSP